MQCILPKFYHSMHVLITHVRSFCCISAQGSAISPISPNLANITITTQIICIQATIPISPKSHPNRVQIPQIPLISLFTCLPVINPPVSCIEPTISSPVERSYLLERIQLSLECMSTDEPLPCSDDCLISGCRFSLFSFSLLHYRDMQSSVRSQLGTVLCSSLPASVFLPFPSILRSFQISLHTTPAASASQPLPATNVST